MERRVSAQLIWYTDEGTGAGVYSYGIRQEFSFSLGKYNTVFQAEVYTIKACTVEYLDRDNRNIYVLLGSQAAIKALDNYQINSKLVWDCHQSPVKLVKRNRVQLIWLPGHNCIEGNETGD
jgi:hypothetical protein